MKISQMTLTDYQYSLYNDYLEKLDDNLVKYSNQNSISIQYWHIIVNESQNFTTEQIQHSYKNFVYDIYHFVPTLEMSPLSYQINYDQKYGGISNVATGTVTIFLVDKPLPGDLFSFYSINDAHDAGEIFRVTNVRYMRTTKNKLKLYQLDFETAPLYRNTVDNFRINKIWYWDTENNRFIAEENYDAFSNMVDNRDALMKEINSFYNREYGYYAASSDVDFEPKPLVFLNTILRRLKKNFNDLEVKPIFGVGTAEIPIEWIYRNDYWDTFTCPSSVQTNGSIQGELFNLSLILSGGCTDCPTELVDELSYYAELYQKVKELAMMLKPLLSEEAVKDITCSKNCCNMNNPNFVNECFKSAFINEEHFESLIQGADGKDTPMVIDAEIKYKNSTLLPLWISYQHGPSFSQRSVYTGVQP